MAKKAKQKPAAERGIDPRLAAKRAEKAVLAHVLRQTRLVSRLARQVKREVEKADRYLRDVSVWLSMRDGVLELEDAPQIESKDRAAREVAAAAEADKVLGPGVAF